MKKENKVIQIGLLVLIIVVAMIVVAGLSKSETRLAGISSNAVSYNSPTNTSITCSGATSTVVAAASSGRLAFEITNGSSTAITLCKVAAGCTWNNGLNLPATSGVYKQTDGYTGAYSCIGNGASSTVGVIYK